MLNESFSLLISLVDIIGEISHLEGTGIFLGHGLDALLHIVELFHILTDLLILLEHVLLDLNGELVKRTLGRVLEAFPLEVANILRVWRYKSRR